VKSLVFLLVLANLLLYAFAEGYFGHPDNPDAGRLEQQVQPERLRIVSRGEAPALPVRQGASEPESKSAEASPVSEKAETDKAEADKPASPEASARPEKDDKAVCLSWRPLPVADADRLSSLLTKRFSGYKLSRKLLTAEGNGWWVFVPPMSGKAEADRKAVELRGLGVTDFFVVSDQPSRFAISLGVFSTEKGGQERLADLKAKGVRSAVLGPRPGKDSQVVLLVRGAAAEKAALLAAVGQALPNAEALACK
jgi:hypothetical protein